VSYNASNVKRVTEGQKLTFRLICQDGKRAEFSINPKFERIPTEHDRHNIGVRIGTDNLPDGVEFVVDAATVRHGDGSVVVRGNHNACAVNFNGEEFPLFSVNFGDVGVRLSVDELQAALDVGTGSRRLSKALESLQGKLLDALKNAGTVPGERGSLYFQALPVEFGGNLIESTSAPNSTYGLESCLESGVE